MAIYYSRISVVARARGHSAVAAAAYRSGIRIEERCTEQVHDYSKRSGVLSARMLAPPSAKWALNTSEAWNRAEQTEVRRNARTAREIVVALPAELTNEQCVSLAHELGQDMVDRYRVAALVAVHAPDAHGDERNRHVHLLLSTRVAGADGYGAKVRLLDDRTTGPQEAAAMRHRIAERLNTALDRAGHTARVDPRPLRVQSEEAAEQGDFARVLALTREPMRHQGRAATALVRRGTKNAVVERNQAIAQINAEVLAWGRSRAPGLQRAAATRARRWARKTSKAATTPSLRRRVLRSGMGPVDAVTHATGADAQLLNDQAHMTLASARLARDQAEAYLDHLAREADRLDAVLRGYFQNVGGSPPAYSPGALGRLPPELLQGAKEARTAYEEASSTHALSRRRTAAAEKRTAEARSAIDATDGLGPSVWQPRTRRQWAELRRQQRAALTRSEAQEVELRSAAAAAKHRARTTEHAWRDKHAALLGGITESRFFEAVFPGDSASEPVPERLQRTHVVDDNETGQKTPEKTAFLRKRRP